MSTNLSSATTHEREFEREITHIATHISRSELANHHAILADEKQSKSDRLKSYCILFTYNRRQKEITKCLDLYELYKPLFDKEFIFLHLFAIAVKESGKRKDYLRSIEITRSALSLYPRHVGALHNLAVCLCRVAEEDGVAKEHSIEMLQEARDTVEEAIELESDYPRFYVTKAAILSALGEHQSALREIYRAIEREDSESSDYPLRITDYLQQKMKIELRQSIDEVTEESGKKLRNAMEEARRSNLEILSFFVAVVSFVIAGLNIAVQFPLIEAIQLMFVLSSAMLLSISGLILLYDSSRSFIRCVRAFGIGAILLLIALATPHAFSGNIRL